MSGRNFLVDPIRSDEDFEDATYQYKCIDRKSAGLLLLCSADDLYEKITKYATAYSSRVCGGDMEMVLEYIQLKRDNASYKRELKAIADKKEATRVKSAATRAKKWSEST